MTQHYEEVPTTPPTLTKEEVMAKTTLREQRILLLAAQEKSNKEIGDELGISEETAKCHRKNVSRKLNVSGKAAFRRLLALLR